MHHWPSWIAMSGRQEQGADELEPGCCTKPPCDVCRGQGDTEWLAWALIKLLAVSTAASDASTSGCAELWPVSHRWQAVSKEPAQPWMALELWWQSHWPPNDQEQAPASPLVSFQACPVERLAVASQPFPRMPLFKGQLVRRERSVTHGANLHLPL